MADPYCLAMVLCDAVHRDPGSGKHTVLGTFSNVISNEYPTKVALSVYFAITDGQGPTSVRIQLVDGTADYVDARNDAEIEGRIFLLSADMMFDSPLMVMEGVVGINTIIPREGLYHCELWAGDSILMSRRLTALKHPLAK